jgi:hypothetical protein
MKNSMLKHIQRVYQLCAFFFCIFSKISSFFVRLNYLDSFLHLMTSILL